MIALLMVITAFVLILIGFRVAFVFGSVALFFAFIFPEDVGIEVFTLLPYRIYGIMQNTTLMAVPLFILMGLVLEKSNMASALIKNMGALFGNLRGGLAISTIVVGAILAAATGIVGASVVMMSVISLPIMIQHGYSKQLASGAIVAAGTLGQIVPPSIVLILLADVMSLSVGDLFKGAVGPSLLLIGLYIAYILIFSNIKKELAPPIAFETHLSVAQFIKSIFAPLLLIVAVLGSIFAGIATPTESASIGVIGAFVLALLNGTLSRESISYSVTKTAKLTAMIFMILIGATAFSLVFNEVDGGDMILEFFSEDIADPWLFIIISMLVIFILGFFIDFVEICFIVVPILMPIVADFGINPLWFALLIALNLQASFLTPPFGFALFYLKGSAKNLVSTKDIYKGVIPFIALQLLALLIVFFFPDIIYLAL